MTLEFLLRRAVREEPDALEMVVITLDRMAEGGIYDQLGGGFARYATDQAWHVPHFEKMLYDNAQLLQLYARAWQVTGNARLPPRGDGDRRLPPAGDATSRGRVLVVAGRRLRRGGGQVLRVGVGRARRSSWASPSRGAWAPPRKGTGKASTCCGARWRCRRWPGSSACDPDELVEELADARHLLFETREARVHPATDDKVLAAWNAMAIRGLAEAGRATGDATYVTAAVRAADFVLHHLRDDRGRLLRSWRNGQGGGPGFADDHALMTLACLTLYETTFELRWFEAAQALADVLIDGFADPERGGFFQTHADDGAAAAAAEGALRQRGSERELGCGRGAAPPGAADRRRSLRARRSLGAAARPRRHGTRADRLRARALRARSRPRPIARSGGGRRARRSADDGPRDGGHPALPAQRRARGRRSPGRSIRRDRCRCSRGAGAWTVPPPRTSASASRAVCPWGMPTRSHPSSRAEVTGGPPPAPSGVPHAPTRMSAWTG